MSTEEHWFSTREIAERQGVAQNTVNYWINHGVIDGRGRLQMLPAMLTPRGYRVRPSSLERFLTLTAGMRGGR